ncbi:class I SAM-dependent methyltransferase [Corynebacterium sp. CCM 8862]|uniref:Class I SAM-dependent methyltransferase n=2 Tax=Corynebacterium mendelii TaxID=2765362 RepID=A0A939E0D3_9CORY|nr:class I SAM-dependent methyltransferase [Corynebacterium mendelii]MBN9644620.1 class I SAM-dependent methyltransferase [Corynebacterium mendelii]
MNMQQPTGDHDDNLYTGPERVWSGYPNAGLDKALRAVGWTQQTVAGTSPVPRALDIGCGEGADAVFMAQLGFAVTACDPVATAIARTEQSAAAAGVFLTTVVAGIDTIAATVADCAVVTSFFVPLIKSRGDLEVLDRLVGPGGALIIAHHDNPSRQLERNGISPDDLIDPVTADTELSARGWQQVAGFTVAANHHSHAHRHRHPDTGDTYVPGDTVIRILRKPADGK